MARLVIARSNNRGGRSEVPCVQSEEKIFDDLLALCTAPDY